MPVSKNIKLEKEFFGEKTVSTKIRRWQDEER
jgi:hypothetical protein